MRALIQRCNSASVTIDGKEYSSIKKGIVVFLGIKGDDTLKDLEYITNKIAKLRIFEDENEKTNLSIKDIGGEILIVSQFTLYADMSGGNRPSFINAARPEVAEPLYNKAVELLSNEFKVGTGVFGADMDINIVNQGPFTIWLESELR